MLDKISKNSFFDSIENIKGIGPKTSKLFEKLCGDRIIDLLLTIPRNYKKRKYIQNISDEYFKQEIALIVNVIKQSLTLHNDLILFAKPTCEKTNFHFYFTNT